MLEEPGRWIRFWWFLRRWIGLGDLREGAQRAAAAGQQSSRVPERRDRDHGETESASSAPYRGPAGSPPNPPGKGPPRTSDSDSGSTLMLDAFMKRADSASGSQQPGQGAAAGSAPGGSADRPEPAYYRTLAGPELNPQQEPPAQPPQQQPVKPDYGAGRDGSDAPAPAVTPGALAPTVAQQPPTDWMIPQSSASLLEEEQPVLIAMVEREEQLARLDYVCHKLREARHPLCALNGVLTLVPLKTIQAGSRENAELQRAVKADLETLQSQLKLRFPSTVLLVGLENDRGFEELVRRVGPQPAGDQRFGHRFDTRATATNDQLARLCARIGGVFEDWVYTIYRERGSTARPGNSHLFGLLCKVRTELQGRLLRVLTGGFGHDPHVESSDEPIAFSGCYFAATGRSEDRRAFVPAVFGKLIEEQGRVEWTGRALAEDRHYRLAGRLGLLIAAVFGCWLAVDVILWLM